MTLISAEELAKQQPSLAIHTVEGGRAQGGAMVLPEATRALVATTSRLIIERLEGHGMSVLRNTEVVDWRAQCGESPKILALRTNRGELQIDEFTDVVVCAGAWTPILLRRLGLYVPMYPMKGLSFRYIFVSF